MKTHFKTYGKIPLYQKVVITLKERFKLNNKREAILKTYGIDSYIPKLNKTRAFIGVVGVIVCIAIPFITPLLIIPLLWGLK